MKQNLIESKTEVDDSTSVGDFSLPSSSHLDESASSQRLPVKRVKREFLLNNVKFQKLRGFSGMMLEAQPGSAQ